MSGLFVLARKASDMKFVTTKHGDAAVRFRGRHTKTASGETVNKKVWFKIDFSLLLISERKVFSAKKDFLLLLISERY